MKPLVVFALATMVSTSMSSATEGYLVTDLPGVVVGASTSGDYVFGCNGISGIASQSSWLFNIDEKYAVQFTDYSEGNLDSGGQVSWINKNGVILGNIRDLEWLAPKVYGENYEEIENYPLFSACLWKDQHLLKLDHNRWSDPADFVAQDGTLPSMGNGFFGKQISEDGSAVVGYLKAFTYMLPVRWSQNEEGEYVSTMLPRKPGEFFYQWVGASSDCTRVIMNTSQSGGLSYIWEEDNEPYIFKYTEDNSIISEPVLTALSPNGKYAIMYCYRDGKAAYGVYDFDSKDLRWIPTPEGASSSNWFAANVITDRADGFICDYNYRLHYFNMALGINIPFSSYIEAFGSDIDIEDGVIPEKALVRMVSADGLTICGNTLRNSLEEKGWLLRLPDIQPMLYALTNCQALFLANQNLLVKWKAPNLPDEASIDHYVVRVDGVDNIIVNPEMGVDGLCRAEISCAGSSHQVELFAIAIDKDGKEWESIHQSLAVSISPDTSLYFFEDLDDSAIDTNVMAYIYAHDTFSPIVPDDSGALSFRLDAGDFCNLTPFWYTCGFSTAEWHTYLESRWFDANDADEDFYFTWHERNMTINDAQKLDEANRLRLEYTIDGENWLLLNESNGKSNNGKWNVQIVDLSDLRGKSFRLRFHAIGGGKYACEWRLDYYGIMPNSCMYDAPKGLMITSESSDKVSFAWKNNRGEYEVSHNYNSPMTYNQNLGNEGKDLYVACDFKPSKLKAFEGKYFTAVSTMLYEPSTVEQSWHTTVQAVIFDENGEELSRGTLAEDAPWYEDDYESVAILPIHHINLDTPVLIQPDKTYRVAILISDYAHDMCPIWYFSASDDYIPGVTDLYSDDNLLSWNSFSDYILESSSSEEEFNQYGRCIFNIRACISDTNEVPSDDYEQTQWFYQVYRDGVALPHGIAYYTQQSVTDQKTAGASYTVRSFRRDGSVSLMSAPLAYQEAGILDVVGDFIPEIKIVKNNNQYQVIGDYDKVSVFSIDGKKVSDSSVIDMNRLPHGFYMIVVSKNGKSASCKIGF